MTTRRMFSQPLVALVVVMLLATASMAAADAAGIVLEARSPASMVVTGPSGQTSAVDLGVGTVTVGLPTAGLHLVERLGSTEPPACAGALVETSGIAIGSDGTTVPLGAAATVDLGPGDEVTCVVD